MGGLESKQTDKQTCQHPILFSQTHNVVPTLFIPFHPDANIIQKSHGSSLILPIDHDMGVYRRLLQLLPASYIWLFLVKRDPTEGHVQEIRSYATCCVVECPFVSNCIKTAQAFPLKFGFYDSLIYESKFHSATSGRDPSEEKIQTSHHPLLRQTNPQQTLIIDLILQWHICFECVNLAVSQINPLHSTRPDQCSSKSSQQYIILKSYPQLCWNNPKIWRSAV